MVLRPERQFGKTISGKLAAVQCFHRANVRVELPTGAPLVNCALKRIEIVHIQVGTPECECQ